MGWGCFLFVSESGTLVILPNTPVTLSKIFEKCMNACMHTCIFTFESKLLPSLFPFSLKTTNHLSLVFHRILSNDLEMAVLPYCFTPCPVSDFDWWSHRVDRIFEQNNNHDELKTSPNVLYSQEKSFVIIIIIISSPYHFVLYLSSILGHPIIMSHFNYNHRLCFLQFKTSLRFCPLHLKSSGVIFNHRIYAFVEKPTPKAPIAYWGYYQSYLQYSFT